MSAICVQKGCFYHFVPPLICSYSTWNKFYYYTNCMDSNILLYFLAVTYLIVILHELNDNADVVRIIFDGDDSHDVGCILCVRILAVLIGQNQTSICFVYLKKYQPPFYAALIFAQELEWECKFMEGWGTIRWMIISKNRTSWWKNFWPSTYIFEEFLKIN